MLIYLQGTALWSTCSLGSCLHEPEVLTVNHQSTYKLSKPFFLPCDLLRSSPIWKRHHEKFNWRVVGNALGSRAAMGWAFCNFPGRREGSSQFSLHCAELIQQQHPAVSVEQGDLYMPSPPPFSQRPFQISSSLHQQLSLPEHRVQMLVAASLGSSCTLQTMKPGGVNKSKH